MVLRSFIFSSEMKNRTLFQMCGRLDASISIQGRVVDPNIYCFFYGSSHVVPLPAYLFEVVHCCGVASSGLVFKNR